MFVFSSLAETLGLAILEATASGLPVIATPAGGVADHLYDAELDRLDAIYRDVCGFGALAHEPELSTVSV